MATASGPGPDTLRMFASKSSISSKIAEEFNTRCCVRRCGLKLALSGTLFRGPALNCQITPSVSPLKWQLEQLCQPAFERRSRSELVPGMESKFPREEKNISAPTRFVSP